jgi:hypothetical protein
VLSTYAQLKKEIDASYAKLERLERMAPVTSAED